MTEVTYFERLDAPECLRLLRGGGVWRVVWQEDDGLSVLPVNYRVIGDSVVFQTNAASTRSTTPPPSAGRCWSGERAGPGMRAMSPVSCRRTRPSAWR